MVQETENPEVTADTAVAEAPAQAEPQQQQQPQEAYPPPQQAYAPPPPQQEEDPIAKLREYAKLHEDGILTDEEFDAQKRKLLG